MSVSSLRIADWTPGRRRRGEEQVAAVCYRVTERGIEFLLVRTRGRGRWTFPKGGVEPGLTLARTAALEAFEEAGVHGRMEETAFARYARRSDSATKMKVSAYLCEVSRRGRPQESKRNPTWFSAEKAKRRLEEGRPAEDAAEFGRVIECAVAHIEARRGRARVATAEPVRDALQRVQFEAPEQAGLYTRVAQATFARYVRRERAHVAAREAIAAAVDAQLCKVLEFASPGRDAKLLTAGTDEPGAAGRGRPAAKTR